MPECIAKPFEDGIRFYDVDTGELLFTLLNDGMVVLKGE